VIKKLDALDLIDHTLIHTGQNYDYELNEVFFKDLGLRKPDFFLEAAGMTPSVTVGNILVKVDPILDRIKPNAFLVLGDTNSCLCAYSAKKRKIPIFHFEAGNRCFDQRVPEETNRKIVDHISDINLTYSRIAREYLLREGLPPDRVINIGSPIYEVLKKNEQKIDASDILKRLKLTAYEYFLVSSHREENVDDAEMRNGLIKTLNMLAEQEGKPVIMSTHPRTGKILDKEGTDMHPLIKLLKPFGYFDYVKLQINARAVLSDSGTISEESSILNFPALNLREAHERPEAMEEAAVPMVGMNHERIFQALALLEAQTLRNERTLSLVYDYSRDNVSEKVIRIILSYTDYVNRVVWQR